jgi:dipeptidyl aminopeptidase/acylaminoacyl peptidase
MFASPGYVVAMINFTGSTGYGQEFTDAISGDWGGRPYTDIMKGTDYVLENYPFIDEQNTGAAGASYGGFMINWIEGHTDRFNCLVSHDGVYDQVSMYGATEELWFPEWEMKGTPWENPEVYRKFSPSTYAANFQTPCLVIHGENDFRVPYTQGLQLFTALQRQGVESRLLYYPDEDHFVRKPLNAELWWGTIHDWFAEYLK